LKQKKKDIRTYWKSQHVLTEMLAQEIQIIFKQHLGEDRDDTEALMSLGLTWRLSSMWMKSSEFSECWTD